MNNSSNNSSNNSPLIRVTNLHKHYRMGNEDLHVLQGIDLSLSKGEWLSILGSSGSGKSTLLHLIGGLDTPDKGSVTFGDQNIFKLKSKQRDYFRNRHVGFVFQAYHLLPELNIIENTAIAGMIGKQPPNSEPLRKRAISLLQRIGLGHRLKHKPRQLSGGERQRVAIARALINNPDILLADEPTGNLDKKTGIKILNLLADLHKEGQTIVMVSHDVAISKNADRELHIEDGKLIKI